MTLQKLKVKTALVNAIKEYTQCATAESVYYIEETRHLGNTVWRIVLQLTLVPEKD